MPETKTPTQVIVGGVLCGLILIVGVGAMFGLGSREPTTRTAVAEEHVPVVAAVLVEAYDGGLNLEVDGVVTPFREIQVSAQIPGEITSKAEICRAGNFVKQGTPLIEIDPEEYELAVLTAERLYEQSIAEANEMDVEISNTHSLIPLAQREVELQQNELARLERLQKSKDGNVISESAVDQARRAVVIAENAYQTMQNRYRLLQTQRERMQIAQQVAKSHWDRAKLDLSRTKIVAPVDGVIVSDAAEQDAYVQKGTALFMIEDTSSIEIKTSLQIDEIYWLWQQADGTTADAATAAQDGVAYQIPEADATVIYDVAGRQDLRFQWRGKLKRYEGSGFDARTRTVPCRIRVDDPRAVEVAAAADGSTRSVKRPPALVRGMYVTAQIHLKPADKFVLVPEIAVQPGKMVWRIRDGKLERLGPLPLARLIDKVEGHDPSQRYWMVSTAEADLQAGDRLVRAGLAGLLPGMKVSEEPAETAPDKK